MDTLFRIKLQFFGMLLAPFLPLVVVFLLGFSLRKLVLLARRPACGTMLADSATACCRLPDTHRAQSPYRVDENGQMGDIK